MNPWAAVVAVILLLLNGAFVALEFALVGSRRTRLVPLADSGDARANKALTAMASLDLELAGAQLGITMASLGLGLTAEPALAGGLSKLFGMGPISHAIAETIAVIVSILIITYLHLVIGEMVPKNIALAHPERTLLGLAGPNQIFMAVFRPLLRILNGAARLCLRMIGVTPRSEIASTHTPEELAAMFAQSHREGEIEDFAADLLVGVLEFGDRMVNSVMVARSEIVTVNESATVAEVERVAVDSGHSRFPVIGKSIDDVRGFVHSKDLLGLSAAAANSPVPGDLLRELPVLACDARLDEVLSTMRRFRVHFARVVGADGSTAGLVTLEDLLEELVGDITDETDLV